MSTLIDKIVMVSMGDHLTLQMPKPGPCGGCATMRSYFINRGGRVLCVNCDERAQKQMESRASALVWSMLLPGVIIPCTCLLSKDPDDLPKCICEANYPENR